MTANTIQLVYQDCPMCGRRREWGDKQLEVASREGVEIVKVPFAQVGAGELIWAACRAGVSLPFFTDGKHFANNLDELLANMAPKKKPQKRAAMTEEKDGDLE